MHVVNLGQAGAAARSMHFDMEIPMPTRIRRHDMNASLPQQADVAGVRHDPSPHSRAPDAALRAGLWSTTFPEFRETDLQT